MNLIDTILHPYRTRKAHRVAYDIAAMDVQPDILGMVLDGKREYLPWAFDTFYTPQGSGFWHCLHRGINPLDIYALREIQRQYDIWKEAQDFAASSWKGL